MNKLRLFFSSVTIFLLIVFFNQAFAQDFPEKSNKLIYDFSDLISAQEEDLLENKLVAYHDSTSTQIAIVTIKSIGGYDVSDYAFKLGEKWGIGQKGKNNGVLILITKEERDIFIATGYGVESNLPDALCRRIEEEIIIPKFKEGKFYEGLNEGTNDIISALSGLYKAEKKKDFTSSKKSLSKIIIIVILIILVLLIRRKGGGPGMRGFGRGFYYGGGWGGFSSGGSSWGSGSFGGGGGFGGFGGGSFGGGGAGGKW